MRVAMRLAGERPRDGYVDRWGLNPHPGDEHMDAIELLESQHEEVLDLFDQYEDVESDEEKLALFEQIADALAAHSTIEEKIFYPAIYTGDLKDQLEEAVEEHLAAKREIADLLKMKP